MCLWARKLIFTLPHFTKVHNVPANLIVSLSKVGLEVNFFIQAPAGNYSKHFGDRQIELYDLKAVISKENDNADRAP